MYQTKWRYPVITEVSHTVGPLLLHGPSRSSNERLTPLHPSPSCLDRVILTPLLQQLETALLRSTCRWLALSSWNQEGDLGFGLRSPSVNCIVFNTHVCLLIQYESISYLFAIGILHHIIGFRSRDKLNHELYSLGFVLYIFRFQSHIKSIRLTRERYFICQI